MNLNDAKFFVDLIFIFGISIYNYKSQKYSHHSFVEFSGLFKLAPSFFLQMALMGSRPGEQAPARPWGSCLTTDWTAGPHCSSQWPCTLFLAVGSMVWECSGFTSLLLESCCASSYLTGRNTTPKSYFYPGVMISVNW